MQRGLTTNISGIPRGTPRRLTAPNRRSPRDSWVHNCRGRSSLFAALALLAAGPCQPGRDSAGLPVFCTAGSSPPFDFMVGVEAVRGSQSPRSSSPQIHTQDNRGRRWHTSTPDTANVLPFSSSRSKRRASTTDRERTVLALRVPRGPVGDEIPPPFSIKGLCSIAPKKRGPQRPVARLTKGDMYHSILKTVAEFGG